MTDESYSEGRHSSREIHAADVFRELFRTVHAVQRRLAPSGIAERLTATQLDALWALLRKGPLSQRNLGAELSRTGGNVTMVVGNLGKRGLVSRQRLVSDKRVVTVHLTDAGRQLIEAVLPIHFKATTAEADRLSPEEQAELVKICRKLRLADNRERIS